jgi:phosphate transport system substrate-binding protein
MRSILVEIEKGNKRTSVQRILVLLVIGAGLAALVYFSPAFFASKEQKSSAPQLKVGGTSVVYVIVENRWKGKYRDAAGVEVAYESTGSTTGAERMIDNTYAIAFTHAPLSEGQRKKAREKGGDVVHIPVLVCGVAPVYNVKELKGKPPLKITGEVLADIFLGKIKKWNDPALEALNPGVALPPTSITVVHRKESSGTTLLFTEYLAAVSAAWRDKVGPPASRVKWPVGEEAARNLGVATQVHRTEGAIGYVDRLFTSYEDMKLDYAAVQNKDKTAYIRAEPENLTAAVRGILAEIPEDLGFDLANKPGKDAYPISGVIYAVCYQAQPEANRKRVVDFLRWATHEGQPFAAKMDYAPLPPELVERIDRRLEAIKATP